MTPQLKRAKARVERAAMRRGAQIIEGYAASIFDSCKGADGDGFVCGDCPAGNDVCIKEHAELVKVAKQLHACAALDKLTKGKK